MRHFTVAMVEEEYAVATFGEDDPISDERFSDYQSALNRADELQRREHVQQTAITNAVMWLPGYFDHASSARMRVTAEGAEHVDVAVYSTDVEHHYRVRITTEVVRNGAAS